MSAIAEANLWRGTFGQANASANPPAVALMIGAKTWSEVKWSYARFWRTSLRPEKMVISVSDSPPNWANVFK